MIFTGLIQTTPSYFNPFVFKINKSTGAYVAGQKYVINYSYMGSESMPIHYSTYSSNILTSYTIGSG
jgi:hypothetical protein